MGRLRFRQIHLDFHTSEEIPGIGERFDAERFAATLERARVDSINLFSKCHHGWVYYDSKRFPKHPHLQRNLLREQIEACHRHGILTPIYISAGWDELTAREHPEWLERTVEGRPFGAGPLQAGWRKLCFNTPYTAFFESQVVDVIQTFKESLDGLWIDIVSQNPCLCRLCMDRMLRTGLNPESERDRSLNADQVLTLFKRRIKAAIRGLHPSCLIYFNAGHVGPYIRETLDTYTHLDLESLPGLRDGWGYEHFPITVRYAKTLGLECIGMTGKFHRVWGDFGGFKNQPALEYECFTALAHGARCSVGDQLHPSGEIDEATYDLVGKVYRQVEAREPWCEDVEPVSEIGLMTPEPAKGTNHMQLSPALRGAYRTLEESHHQFNVIDDQSDFGPYRVLVLPDEIVVDEPLKARLFRFVADGGSLLVSHQSGLDASTHQYTIPGIGVEFEGDSPFEVEYVSPGELLSEGLSRTLYALYDRGVRVRASAGTKVLARIWQPYFNRTYRHFCSHFQTPPDRDSGAPEVTQNGRVILFAHPIFRMIHLHGALVYKRLVLNALKRLLPQKLVESNAPSTAHLVLNRQPQQGRTVLHILHYIPEARSKHVDVIEDVLPLHDLTITVRLPGKPTRVLLAPANHPLEFTASESSTAVRIPKIEGHAMVVFED